MGYRTVAVPQVDDLTAAELTAKVEESLAAVQMTQSSRPRPATPENAVKPKADFGEQLTLAASAK